MASFEKPSELAVELYSALSAGLECEHRKMFGCPCAFKNGNMFFGVFAQRLFFRLSAEEKAARIAPGGGFRVFEPVAGRPMREYVEILARKEDHKLLELLLDLAYIYASSLPPKEKAAKIAKASASKKAPTPAKATTPRKKSG